MLQKKHRCAVQEGESVVEAEGRSSLLLRGSLKMVSKTAAAVSYLRFR